VCRLLRKLRFITYSLFFTCHQIAIISMFFSGSNSSPGNSLPRRSPKRREINNHQLRDVILPILLYVRTKQVIPYNSPVLHMAFQRGLIQRPFPFDVVAGAEKFPPSYLFWLVDYNHPDYENPRLFNHYYVEVKVSTL